MDTPTYRIISTILSDHGRILHQNSFLASDRNIIGRNVAIQKMMGKHIGHPHVTKCFLPENHMAKDLMEKHCGIVFIVD